MKKKRKGYSRNCQEYREWKRLVYERDNYTCQHCGSKEKLAAHHIVEWNDSIELRFELSNGQTLCTSCHRAEHNRRMINPKKGKKLSKETRLKMSLAQKGHKVSKEARKKMSLAKLGKPSPKKGKKMPEGWVSPNIGRKATIEQIKKLSDSHKGYKHTEEQKEKIRKKVKESWSDPNLIKKQSEKYKGKKWKIDPETGKRKWF